MKILAGFLAVVCLSAAGLSSALRAETPPADSTAGDDGLHFGRISLDPSAMSFFVQPGQLVVVKMNVSQLTDEVKACQAFLGYDSAYLTATSVAAGGGAWDDLIYAQYSMAGAVDTAVGVYGETRPGSGTSGAGTIAVITFLAGGTEGTTRISFRPDVDDVQSTFLANMAGQAVWPTTAPSPFITIDGTAPAVGITGVQQNGINLLAGNGPNAVQGTVDITVVAGDLLSGLAGPPTVTVTPNGGLPVPATLTGESPTGVFHYAWTVSPTTPNGLASVSASAADRAGNVALTDTKSFNVNKNRISGRIELQSFVGSSHTVVFTATGSHGTKTWAVDVTGFVSHTAPYSLDDVPAGLTGLSAKTNCHLRRKLSLTLDSRGQAIGSFTDASKLLGGDLNASNLINVPDYTILRSLWFSENPAGDINGDGIVNTADYLIMKSNWFLAGDPE